MKRIRVWGLSLLVALSFGVNAWAVEEIRGANAGDGDDTNVSTFHFNSANVDFQMTQPDGTPLSNTQVTYEYGKSMLIYEDNIDYLSKWGLKVVGASLSGTNWTTVAYPPADTVAIDPALGRIKFSMMAAWKGAQGIDNASYSGFASYSPKIAMNNKGQAIAVWEQITGVPRIYAAHYSPSAGWYQLVTINTDNGHAAIYPRITLNESGQAIAVWEQSDGAMLRLYANRYEPGVGWYQAVTIDAQGIGTGISQQQTDVAMNNAGNAFAVFIQDDGVGPHVYAARYTPTGGWYRSLTIQPASVAGAASSNPRVAINNDGNAFCAFEQFNATPRIAVNRFTPGAGWEIATYVDNGTTNPGQFPRISLNDNNQAVCVYQQPDGSAMRIYANLYNNGWQAIPTVIDANTITYSPMLAEVDMNNNGQIACVFNQPDAVTLRVWANRYVPGYGTTGWYGAVTIDAKNGYAANNPVVAINDNNQILCAYGISGAPWPRPYVTKYEPGTGWLSAQNLDRSDFVDTLPGGPYPMWAACLNNAGDGFDLFYQMVPGLGYRLFANPLRGSIPYGAMQVNYFNAPPTPTPTSSVPAQNAITISSRKIQPLLGQKVQVTCAVKDAGLVSIKIYNLRGELVKVLADQYLAPGTYTLLWGAETANNALAASGVYVIHVKTPNETKTQKVIVVK